jgi:hypothetical protein
MLTDMLTTTSCNHAVLRLLSDLTNSGTTPSPAMAARLPKVHIDVMQGT